MVVLMRILIAVSVSLDVTNVLYTQRDIAGHATG